MDKEKVREYLLYGLLVIEVIIIILLGKNLLEKILKNGECIIF